MGFASNQEFLLSKEIELVQLHDQIIAEREALLHGREGYYDHRDQRVGTFIASYSQAMQRNAQLMERFRGFKDFALERSRNVVVQHETIEKNYFSMMRNMLPMWLDELREYRRRTIRAVGEEEYRSDPEHRRIDELLALPQDLVISTVVQSSRHTPRSSTRSTPRSPKKVTPRSPDRRTPRSIIHSGPDLPSISVEAPAAPSTSRTDTLPESTASNPQQLSASGKKGSKSSLSKSGTRNPFKKFFKSSK